MSIKKSGDVNAPIKTTEPAKKEQGTKIRLLCNPTGMYNLANNYGDVLELSPELTKQILDAGDAEIVK